MAETQDATYLSIGEVLGLLLEEFPDITISKIRFLESQGLISPERTASGYRKFYDPDVELLRVILTEQRNNYLPLRVIKDRLANGELDPTGDHPRPDDDHADGSNGAPEHHRADRDGDGSARGRAGDAGSDELGDDVGDDAGAEVPTSSIAAHPAARGHAPSPEPAGQQPGADAPAEPDTTSDPADTGDPADAGDPADTGDPAVAGDPVGAAVAADVDEPAVVGDDDPSGPNDALAAALLPGVLLDRGELCAMVGMTESELDQLESFGIVPSRDSTGSAVYGDDAVEIARPACELLRAGVDARHLRGWRTSAEREASLFEQLVTPRFRQRNPAARAEALGDLRRLDELGGSLRAAMTRHALRHNFEA
jgi:DNA-binding transcriptional MerR regulator